MRYLIRVAALGSAIGLASRRRAGFAFGPEPRDLTPEDFGQDAAAGLKVVAICEDPQLRVQLVSIDEDGNEEARVATKEDVAELAAFIEVMAEAEASKTDPNDPPIPELNGAKVPGAELQTLGGSAHEPEGAAAPEGEDAEKVAEVKDAAAVDPAGAEDGSASTSEQAREQAETVAADQKAAVAEEHQPEGTVPPPVAEKKKKTSKA